MAKEPKDSAAEPTVHTLSRTKIDRWGRSQYRLNGSNYTTVRFGASFFTGDPPETIGIVGPMSAAAGTSGKKARETMKNIPKHVQKAARKAARDARAAVIAAAMAAAAGEGEEATEETPEEAPAE